MVMFVAVPLNNPNGWFVCRTGPSLVDGEYWSVTTAIIRTESDPLPESCIDAKPTAELIARLLNLHFEGGSEKAQIECIAGLSELTAEEKLKRILEVIK